jgi:uncharacterized protein YjbJ (UPF0337 family)
LKSSIERLTAQMVTKQEQEKNVYTYRVDFAQLKSEIQMMEKNDFALMKAEHDKLMNEIDRLKGKLKEDINRTQSSVRLDINLEKGRLRDESSQQDIKLEEARSKIEGEIGNLKTQMEGIKFQILQYMIGKLTIIHLHIISLTCFRYCNWYKCLTTCIHENVQIVHKKEKNTVYKYVNIKYLH